MTKSIRPVQKLKLNGEKSMKKIQSIKLNVLSIISQVL